MRLPLNPPLPPYLPHHLHRHHHLQPGRCEVWGVRWHVVVVKPSCCSPAVPPCCYPAPPRPGHFLCSFDCEETPGLTRHSPVSTSTTTVSIVNTVTLHRYSIMLPLQSLRNNRSRSEVYCLTTSSLPGIILSWYQYLSISVSPPFIWSIGVESFAKLADIRNQQQLRAVKRSSFSQWEMRVVLGPARPGWDEPADTPATHWLTDWLTDWLTEISSKTCTALHWPGLTDIIFHDETTPQSSPENKQTLACGMDYGPSQILAVMVK